MEIFWGKMEKFFREHLKKVVQNSPSKSPPMIAVHELTFVYSFVLDHILVSMVPRATVRI